MWLDEELMVTQIEGHFNVQVQDSIKVTVFFTAPSHHAGTLAV